MRSVSKGIVVFAGLLAAPLGTKVTAQMMPVPQVDQRLVRLRQFLEDNDCPINHLAEDFIAAADTNELDWRLLPSISFIESSGGKSYRNNNIFGWKNCRRRFPSVRAGIHIVAERLGNSKLYRDKDLNEILRTYNPENPDYGERVKAVMDTLGTVDQRGQLVLN